MISLPRCAIKIYFFQKCISIESREQLQYTKCFAISKHFKLDSLVVNKKKKENKFIFIMDLANFCSLKCTAQGCSHTLLVSPQLKMKRVCFLPAYRQKGSGSIHHHVISLTCTQYQRNFLDVRAVIICLISEKLGSGGHRNNCLCFGFGGYFLIFTIS